MKAAVYYETGPPSVFKYEDVSDPTCPPGGRSKFILDRCDRYVAVQLGVEGQIHTLDAAFAREALNLVPAIAKRVWQAP